MFERTANLLLLVWRCKGWKRNFEKPR